MGAKGLVLKFFTIAAFGLFSLQANAALVYTFSDLSSDATPASDLDATLSFSVASTTGNDVLTLTLENQTTAPSAFTIDELYFNFTGDSSLIDFDSANTGSGKLFNTGSRNAANFGSFDVQIGGPANNQGIALASGGTETWLIDLGATGITSADFNLLSTNPPGDTEAFAALKFVQGPDDPEKPGFEDSAFGAVVPVPAAVWLFGSGLLGLVGVARRKRA